MQSIIQPLGKVPFPAFMAERVYMREFTKSAGLPPDLSRWQQTIDAMLDGVEVDGPIFMMVDQGLVPAGKTHRRPGLHLDGYWRASSQDHGGRPPGHITRAWDTGQNKWKQCDFSKPEALILASDVAACRAFIGEWDGECGEGGDCSHINTRHMREINLAPGVAYAGNVTMLHESLPVKQDTARTLVRLSVPGWSPA